MSERELNLGGAFEGLSEARRALDATTVDKEKLAWALAHVRRCVGLPDLPASVADKSKIARYAEAARQAVAMIKEGDSLEAADAFLFSAIDEEDRGGAGPYGVAAPGRADRTSGTKPIKSAICDRCPLGESSIVMMISSKSRGENPECYYIGGRIHFHSRLRTTEIWGCERGHRWQISSSYPCPTCEFVLFPDDRIELPDADARERADFQREIERLPR